MFGFNKQKDEIKKEVQELVNEGKLLSLGVLAVSCLTVGYILGSVTTGVMCQVLVKVK